MVQAAPTRYAPSASTTHLNWQQKGQPLGTGGRIIAEHVSGTGRSLGAAIRSRRRELGMTQMDLVKQVAACGISIRQSDVSRLEREKITLPQASRLAAIAEALNLSMGDLLNRAGWDGAAVEFPVESVEVTVDRVETPQTAGNRTLSVSADEVMSLLNLVRETRARCDTLRRQLDGNWERSFPTAVAKAGRQ